jgi:hypothetical protein
MPISLNDLPTQQELEVFFCEGMRTTGWSSPTPQITAHPYLLEGKQTVYSVPFGNKHKLLLTDSWRKGEGLTKITLCLEEGGEILLWIMHYTHNKIFPKESLPFLTSVLHAAYTAGRFYGGRGKSGDFTSGEMLYSNSHSGGFKGFNGVETLHKLETVSKSRLLLGNTHYWGGLVPG